MAAELKKARDLGILDRLDSLERTEFKQDVWRVCRTGRDPILGTASASRWCNGEFDVLYTSLTADGARAEIFAFLNDQPVFPSKIQYKLHKVSVTCADAIVLPDMDALGKLGIDVSRYRDREYSDTQQIADAAYFLGFNALVAPSARWPCMNAILFTDRLGPADLSLNEAASTDIDWQAWRRSSVRGAHD
ncbi:RES family NAD+ phosphorylase [Asticcacaulis solisilvae]|uniref:RES family NAD+ phosphorylase n=1 Tax=Asticcacaulis solisilvae TaxID=1217274 RepID=UPI003FD76B15